jgi:hypothetical protein
MSKFPALVGTLLLSTIALAQVNKGPKITDWWEREFWSRLSYSGSRTLGYQTYTFEGDSDAFGSLTNYGTGLQHFTDIGNISIQGQKVLGLLDFRASFSDNRFSDPEQQQYTLNYKRGSWDVSYGTVQASLLNGNRFANFSRSLKGLVGDYKKGKFEAKVISSEARGAARTVTIEGNNTSGPYYLSSGRIIGGSVKILLDGTELHQGVDYLVDAAVGSITFIGRQIPPTSSIVASYESFDITGSGGSIRGAGLTYDLGPAGKIGFTTQQQRTGNGSGTNERLEQFQGFGRPGDQYPLQFEPIPASIIVTVDGIVRSFSVVDDGISEFFLSSSITNVVISRVAILSSKTIQIRYLPKLVVTVDGDRSVTAFDWRLPIGTKGTNSYITYSQANGKLSGSAPSSGGAQSLDLRLAEGKGEFKMGARKIDPGYRTIEQTGFSRNEDATEYSFNYNTKGLDFTTTTNNSLIATSTTQATSSSRVVSTDVTLKYSDPKNAGKNITRSQSLSYTKTDVDSTSDTNLSSVAYKENYQYKKLNFSYGVDNLSGRGLVNGAMTGLGVNSYRTSAAYDAGQNITLVASASKSFVRTDTIHSEGYDYSLRANLAQTGPWTLGTEYALSDSGVLASLGGFLNGSSFGYGTGGFGGTGGTGTLSTGALQSRRSSFNVTHHAGQALTLGATYSNTTSVGSSTSNSKIDVLSLNASWRINSTHTFDIEYSTVKSNFFVGNSGTNDSTYINGYLTGNPGRQWSYSLGYNVLESSGAQLGQDNLGLSLGVNYQINRRQRLFYESTLSRTRGLFPQDDINFQAGYAYTISNGITLIGKYNYRNLSNLDPAAVGGAFRAKGLSIELKFDLMNRR